jgi:hypothetical protein
MPNCKPPEGFLSIRKRSIKMPKSQQAVQRYITKYVLRGVEIDFGGPLMSENGWRNGGHGGKL